MNSTAVKITADGQIPLPAELREALGLGPSQKVHLFRRGTEIVIRLAADETSLQERVETILRRSKVRAAALAGEVTEAEAWAIYDKAAAALRQDINEHSIKPNA